MKLESLTKKLTKHLSAKIAELTKQIKCDHKFCPHGFGYKCDKCGLYTGTWSEDNYKIHDIIKKNLEEKK